MDRSGMMVVASCLVAAVSCLDGAKQSEDKVSSDQEALSASSVSAGAHGSQGGKRRDDHDRGDHDRGNCGEHHRRNHHHPCKMGDAATDAGYETQPDAAPDAGDATAPDVVADAASDDDRPADGGTVDLDAGESTDSPAEGPAPCGMANQPCCTNGFMSFCNLANPVVCQLPGVDGIRRCVPCGGVRQPCCALSACDGDTPSATVPAVCRGTLPVEPPALQLQCQGCGNGGQPCCTFNHGSTWEAGCSGSAGIRNQCAVVDGQRQCEGCGLQGQPCCSAARQGGPCLGGLICSTPDPTVPGGPLLCRTL